MRLQISFLSRLIGVTPHQRTMVNEILNLPIEISNDIHKYKTISPVKEHDGILMFDFIINGSINSTKLKRIDVISLGETNKHVYVGIDEIPLFFEFANSITNAITFLTDISMALSVGDKVICAETETDEKALDKIGSRTPHSDLDALCFIRTLPNKELNAENIFSLIPNHEGLMLYANATSLVTDSAKYREFWRILESAFRTQGSNLVNIIASYEPAKNIGFTKKELEQLLSLRDDVSHAARQSGTGRLHIAESNAGKNLGRIKCLAEQVIYTKAQWAKRNTNFIKRERPGGWVGPRDDNSCTF